MATVHDRVDRLGTAARVAAEHAWPVLRRVGLFLIGLLWTLVYLFVRLIESSPRVLFGALLLSLVCAVVAWNLTYLPDLPLVVYAGLVLALTLMYGAEPWWVDYRAKLVYLAEAQPTSRCLLVDADLRHQSQGWRRSARFYALAVALLLAMVLGAMGWARLTLDLQAAVTGFVAAVAGVVFLYQAVVVGVVERRKGVAYYLSGWRPFDPAAAEQRALERWPALAEPLAWRARLSRPLRPVRRALRPLLRPFGECVG